MENPNEYKQEYLNSHGMDGEYRNEPLGFFGLGLILGVILAAVLILFCSGCSCSSGRCSNPEKLSPDQERKFCEKVSPL